MSNIIGKEDFKYIRHSVHLVITALIMFYIGSSSFRKIFLMINILYNVKIYHVTISSWFKKFAPIFHSKMLILMPYINFDSDEWYADETVVKILGKKYYIWFIIDSETRFILGFHLSPFRDSKQDFTLFNNESISENLILLLLIVILPIKCLLNQYLILSTLELLSLKTIFLTMLLKLLISNLSIGIKLDMVLILLKVLTLWL